VNVSLEKRAKIVLTPTKINYVKGDATKPQSAGKKIVAHVCNNIRAWGAGFVLALSKRWKMPEERYRSSESSLELGTVQFIPVTEDVIVANMVAQEGLKRRSTDIPLRYESLRECLAKVADFANFNSCSVHMPRIGCGLAGGEWYKVEKIIEDTLLASRVPVTVYDL
jgi:O-acetyl-ADP-ribose deacetylase (regulator of RNase III)